MLIHPRTKRPIKAPALVEPLEPPPTWGADELTKYLDGARHNQWATFAKKRTQVKKLIAIDSEYMKVSKNWLNPKREIPAQLFLRAHAAFRGSVGHAMAGQVREAFVVCRAHLEDAAYALHIHRDVALEQIWLNRHDDAVAMKKQKKAFAHPIVLDSVKIANRHAGERFEELYQLTIDFGGHPNERSVTTNLKMTKEADQLTMQAIMQHGDGTPLNYALKFVARAGVVGLEMLSVAFGPRFELLGINAAILELRRGL